MTTFTEENSGGDYYNHTAVNWQIDKGHSEKVNNPPAAAKN